MDNNLANKRWIWIVMLLGVICNIALVATIWFRPHESFLPPPPRPAVNFNQQLHFTKEQNDQFEQMRVVHRAKIDSLKKLAKNVREQFFAELRKGTDASAPSDSIGNMLGNYHKLIELQTYAHFKAVREILNPQQKVIFDSIIVDVLKSLPEQPRTKGDGSGRPPGDGYGSPPPPGERFNHEPPPRPEDNELK